MAIRALRPGNAVGDRAQPAASVWADTPRPGTPGDDTITGTPGNDTIYGDGGDDTLFGVGGDDYLNGGAGDDVLEGGRDADLMVGGTGNDTYYVDKILSYSDFFVIIATYPGDEIVELAGEGFDTVYVGLAQYDRTYQFEVDHYSLGADDEIEVLAARNPASGRIMKFGGNDFPNVIYGAANIAGFGDQLVGRGGDDVLHGLGGDDELYGGEGNDVIVGGTGNDRMYGNSGDDVYYADNPGDLIFEAAGEGLDRVAASTSLSLMTDQEIEILDAVNLTSTDAMNLAGTNTANVISGNNGVNVLYGLDGNDVLNGAGGDDVLVGGAGNDTMSGGAGSDKYYVTDAGDVIVEPVGPGDDIVAANVSYTLGAGVEVEFLEPVTFNATDPLNLTGNEFGTWVRGNNGANLLDGKGGGDTLEGLGGADTYAFTSALGGSNVDLVVGFVSGSDRIALDDAVFTGLSVGALPAGAFVVGSQAGDADDRIIYDPTTGSLFFDADGNGATTAVQFATLGTGLNIAASDFLVI